MKETSRLFFALFILLTGGCSLIEGIFEIGLWAGLIVAIVAIVIIFVIVKVIKAIGK